MHEKIQEYAKTLLSKVKRNGISPCEKPFFVYTKNIPGPPQVINYPDRGPELGSPILKKFTLGWAGPTRRLGRWKNSGPEMGPEAPK